MFKVKWCWLSTALALIASIYIVKKELLFSLSGLNSWFVSINIIFFIILFSLSFSCTIRSIRIKLKELRGVKKGMLKEGWKGIANLILYVIGFTALQTCVVGGMCGVNLAIPLLTLVLPFSVSRILMMYGEWILFAINILLILSLLSMRCFYSSAKTKESIVKVKLNY